MLQEFDSKNRNLLINVNGKLLHRNEARISPFDSVVQGGDAVWEGLRVYSGRVFGLTAHLERLRRSAKALSFETLPSNDEIIHEIRRTLEANAMHDNVHIRVTLTRGEKITSGMDPRLNQSGPTLIVLAEHKPPVYDKSGLTLITSSVQRFPPECLDAKIHHNNLLQSILAKIEANNAGADDAIMLDKNGFVAETNATNLFLVVHEHLATPRTVACPEGITRQSVLNICQEKDISCEVRDIPLSEFHSADEVFCTGTMGEIAAITKIDERIIGTGKPGEMTARVSDWLRDKIDAEAEPVL